MISCGGWNNLASVRSFSDIVLSDAQANVLRVKEVVYQRRRKVETEKEGWKIEEGRKEGRMEVGFFDGKIFINP